MTKPEKPVLHTTDTQNPAPAVTIPVSELSQDMLAKLGCVRPVREDSAISLDDYPFCLS